MMSADPPENREAGQGNQAGHCDTGHPQPSGGQRSPQEAPSHQESTPHREAKTVSRGGIPTTAIQRSSLSSSASSSLTPAASLVITTTTTTTTASDGDVTTAITGTNADDKSCVISTTDRVARSSSSLSTSKEIETITRNPVRTTTAFTSTNENQTSTTTLTTTSTSTATATIQTTSTTTATTTSFSHPSTSTTTTTTFSQKKSPSSTISSGVSTPMRAGMGLHHPIVGVNGHALPRGAGENRDAPRNPPPLPTAPSASPVRHRERLIGPVIASVAPPPLRLAEAQRERERLSSVNQRLMSKPVKRKLWEVDHDKLGQEIEDEYKQLVEEDEKRFKERWEELGPEETLSAPRFYYSEVITPTKRDGNKSSTSSSTTSGSAVPPASSSSPAVPVSTGDDSASRTSSESVAKATSSTGNADVETSYPTTDRQRKSGGSPDDPRSSGTPAVVAPENRGQAGGVVEGGLLSEKQNLTVNKRQRTSDISSPATSPSPSISTSSSALNLSTSSRSSSGVSSLESTPTQTITPVGSDTPAREAAPVGRIAPTQETTAPTQRPTTRSCRLRRSSQRTDSGPPRKHLRM